MGSQDVFKGALGWDDWIWWAIIGGLGLLILLLLVCCCVCVQRAKRKGHQEALATVQRRQREADQRRVQQQQQQQQQQQFAMQQQQQQQQQMGRFPPPQAVPTTPDQLQNGNGNYAYSKPVNAVPLAPQPQRKPMGPQVAANGYMLPPEHQQQQFGGQPPQHQPYNNQQQFPPYNQQQQFGGAQPQFAMAAAVPPPPRQHQQQYQKPYPPLPQQQQQYQQQQQQRPPPPPPQPEPEQPAPAPMKRRYRPPQRWYNATLENNSTPSAAAGSNPSAPAASSPTSRSYHNAFVDDEATGNTLDSIRYDPYGADGNLNTAPFMSVTSPTKTGKKTPAQAKPPTTSLAKGVGINTSQQKPPPVVTTKYQSAPALPPASPVGSFSGTRGASDTNMAVMGTSLAQRIDALRDGSFEMAHSRISDNPGDLHSPADLSTSAFASYSASSPASSRQPLQPSDRRSAVLVGSVLSPNSSSSRSGTTVSSHPFSTFTQDEPTPVHHNAADDSFDASLFDSSERSARTQTASHRSVGSNYSNGQFDDADHPTTPRAKPALDTRSSVEF